MMRLLRLVPQNTNIEFLRIRNVAMAISVITIIISIILVATRGLNFGVDFIGGQMIQATFVDREKAPVTDLRDRINALDYGDATIQIFGNPNQVSIRMGLKADDSGELSSAEQTKIVIKIIEEAYPGVRIDGVDAVSGKVSAELFEKGAISLIAALLAISIYIWIRFEWQFGVGALFALFHDVVLTFGLFAATQLEFNLNIVAAILTIIGYSLNDTIVVFDRIRENLRKYRKMDILGLFDLSLNETLARTVMTSVTMLVALAALIFAGPKIIFGFAVAMFFGVFVGTYSSVYMATPVLVWLGVSSDSFIPEVTGADIPSKGRE